MMPTMWIRIRVILLKMWRNSPQWNESLLEITYDEHGGFFDHVKTSYVNVPSLDGNTGPAPSFDRLGVRAPTIMVSPRIKKGTGKMQDFFCIKTQDLLIPVQTSRAKPEHDQA
ncbi:putative phosphoesterase, alkaline-phosphatase-like, core domain superfamily [Helianthus anomalus]